LHACSIASMIQVVFEHAQKLSKSEKVEFQPPIQDWWKISDILVSHSIQN